MPHKPIKYSQGYRIDFEHSGVRYRRQGFTSYAQAIAAIESIISGDGTLPTDLFLRSYADRYIAWSRDVKRKSPKTIRCDTQRLGVFTDWCEKIGLNKLGDLNVNHLREFQTYYFANAPFSTRPYQRRKEPNTAATWEKYRQVLSAFFNWCADRKLIAKNPLSRAAEFKVKSHREIPEIFTPNELKGLFKYFDALTPHISAFYRLLAYTGVRLSEATQLEWKDVDLDGRTIHIHHTKNYEPRLLPISSKFFPYLEALPQDTKYVFDDGAGNQLYHSSHWWSLLREATEACNISPRKLHSFRHTFGSTLAANDINLKTIKDLMGHKSIETTLIYLHFSKEKKLQAIERLPY